MSTLTQFYSAWAWGGNVRVHTVGFGAERPGVSSIYLRDQYVGTIRHRPIASDSEAQRACRQALAEALAGRYEEHKAVMNQEPHQIVSGVLRRAALQGGAWLDDASLSTGRNIAENYVAALNVQPGHVAYLDRWEEETQTAYVTVIERGVSENVPIRLVVRRQADKR